MIKIIFIFILIILLIFVFKKKEHFFQSATPNILGWKCYFYYTTQDMKNEMKGRLYNFDKLSKLPIARENQYKTINFTKNDFNKLGFNDDFHLSTFTKIISKKTGKYEFKIDSDDGSRLKIYNLENKVWYNVIDNDGLHPSKTIVGSLKLINNQNYIIHIYYFNAGGESSLNVYIKEPNESDFNFLEGGEVVDDSLLKTITMPHLNRPVGAILYQNSPSQSGWEARITEGNWDYQAFSSIFGAQNDDTSWIRVNPGYTAILYQHGDFTGTSTGMFSEGDYNLTTSDMNNEASSIKVISKKIEPIGAILYQHDNNMGWAARFPTGLYNYQDYVKQGAIIDDASSIVVNKGYKATLYKGMNLDGDEVEFTESSNSFGSNNDIFKSIKVELLSSSNPTTSITIDRFLTCNDNQYLSNYDQILSAINSGNQVPNADCKDISICNENEYVSKAAERINMDERNIGRYKSDITCNNLNTCNATYPSNIDPPTQANMCRQFITKTHQVGDKDSVGSNREFRDFTESRICNDPIKGVYRLDFLDSIPNSVNGFYYRDKKYKKITVINECSEENIYDPNNPN